MARMQYSDFALERKLDMLEHDFRRQVTEKVLWAGGKVLVKEMRNAIEESHHVVNRYMKDSVEMSEVHTDIDYSYIDVATEGTDPRGVSNAMKNKIINYGYYNEGTGVRYDKDPYLKRLRKRVEPRLNSVMTYQMELTLKELGIIE